MESSELRKEMFMHHLSKKKPKCKTVHKCKICGYSKVKNINKNHIVVDVICLICNDET